MGLLPKFSIGIIAMSKPIVQPLAAVALVVAAATGAPAAGERAVCANAVGRNGGFFYTLWRDTGQGCLRLGARGSYSVDWRLGASGNLVAGKGWRTGRLDRVVHYTARAFEPGRNGYLSLYGWSTHPLAEYYIVDSWGGFVPPGDAGTLLGTVESDGGTYRVYRTRRVNQPSIAGTATFDQYWSVRTERRPLGHDNAITFANHVAAWRRAGLVLGRFDYQLLATEGFGSDGRSDVTVSAQ